MKTPILLSRIALISCVSCSASLAVAQEAKDKPNQETTTTNSSVVIVTQKSEKDAGQGGGKALVLQKGEGGIVTTKVEGSGGSSEDIAFVTLNLEQPKIWIGIGLKEIEGDLAKYLGSTEGIFVESVYPDSPASKAEFAEGDVLLFADGEKIASPMVLLEKLQAISKDFKKEAEDALPTIKFKLLRKGESKEIEVKPVARPERVSNVNVKIDGSASVVQGQDLSKLLSEIEANGAAEVFKFGAPQGLKIERHDSANESKKIVIAKDDGEKVEVTIERKDKGPAKLTVKEGGKVRELTEDQLSELPKMLHAHVEKLLKHVHEEGAIHHEKLGSAAKEAIEQAEKQLRSYIVIGPDGTVQEGPAGKEMAEKFRKLAEESRSAAKRYAETAKKFSEVPVQVDSLREEVEALRKQVKELKAELEKK